jgi:MYXO-CTERM domain-containing protein
MCFYMAGTETIGGCPPMNVDAGLPDVVVSADVVGGLDADPVDAPMSRDVQSTTDTGGGRDGSNAGDANGSDAGTEPDATEPSDSSVALDGAGEPDGGGTASEKFGFRGSGCQCATAPGTSGSTRGVRMGLAALCGLLVARRRAWRAPRA